MTTARARARAELTREIKASARRQIAEVGASALSLRAVSRELGMVSSALYRYFPSRDALLTALIVDAFDAVGAVAEEVETEVPATSGFARRWVALGTDGWPADMAAEEAALIRLGAATQDMSVIGRLMAGERLVAERFGAAARALTPGALGDLMVREKGRVRHVLIDGRLVVRDGMLVHADLPAIELRARAQADRLWQRMATIS